MRERGRPLGISSKVIAAGILTAGSIAYAGGLFGGPPRPTADRSTNPPPRQAAPSPTPLVSQPSSSPSVGLMMRSPSAARKGIPAGTQKGVVEKVVDGDTIWVRIDEPGGPLTPHATHKIRLLEIDTPETVDPSRSIACFGAEASAFAKQQLTAGSAIYLLADEQDRDRYGRFLRYAWMANGEFYNEQAIRLGYARAVLYPPNDMYIELMRAAEAEAKAANRGLWGSSCLAGSSIPRPSPNPVPPPLQAFGRPAGSCHPSYPDFCIKPAPPDLDCPDVGRKGFTVRHDVPDPDPHGFDGDKDGVGCES